MMGIIGNMVGEGVTGETMYEQYAAGHISPFGDGQGVFWKNKRTGEEVSCNSNMLK